MKELSQEEIEQICGLYKEHGSVRAVIKRMPVSNGSAHKYLTLKHLIRKQNIVRELKTHDERLIGVYVGLWMGDGTQYKDGHSYTIKICTNSDDVNLNKFVKDLIILVFNKNTSLFKERHRKSAYIKFSSRFIFEFIHDYVVYDEKKKTYTVGLRKRANAYPKEFREGCLLGLALSDGYLKNNFVFTVSSARLARNMYDLLAGFRYNPCSSLDRREKYHKNIMYSIKLTKPDSMALNVFLDKVIRSLGYTYSFKELKYGPGEI